MNARASSRGHPHVGQRFPVDAAAGLVAPLVIKIDGDEVPVGVVDGGPDDEIADPAADLQRQRVIVAEDGRPVGGAGQLLGPEVIGGFDMDEGLGHAAPLSFWIGVP